MLWAMNTRLGSDPCKLMFTLLFSLSKNWMLYFRKYFWVSFKPRSFCLWYLGTLMSSDLRWCSGIPFYYAGWRSGLNFVYLGSCGFLVDRLSRGLWLQLCGCLCFSGFPFLIIWPRDNGSSHGPCQFSHGLHRLTLPVVGPSSSWPEIDTTKDAPQDPWSHLLLFKAQCSESPLLFSTLIALCLCASSVFPVGWNMEGKLVSCILSAAVL